jgi:hypothetical protein
MEAPLSKIGITRHIFSCTTREYKQITVVSVREMKQWYAERHEILSLVQAKEDYGILIQHLFFQTV